MENPEEKFRALAETPTAVLMKQAGVHLAAWVAVFSMFAAADGWYQLTGWSMASLLSVITGLAAGFLTVNLVHEWFHYFGAKLTSANYKLSAKPSLFVFDWDFEKNGLGQFYTMSIAGTLGGATALLLISQAIDIDSTGRAALVAGAAASFAFGSIIEWPVLLRTRKSKNPLQELSGITPAVLGKAATGSAVTGLICLAVLT
ncbi:hypothetical protein EY643_01100 [Halioglobus maricola]|uniref:Uncharacterized protein n=1 Tax=Halioglobus maricola TaxID=2601894 RepID=A0A5P9NF14_9GAMM|nr:hypothetical protein [Halioglobus maricola]QFU74357.1 hypothetical protein EY643_01100 [Halioglobus maricola]